MESRISFQERAKGRCCGEEGWRTVYFPFSSLKNGAVSRLLGKLSVRLRIAYDLALNFNNIFDRNDHVKPYSVSHFLVSGGIADIQENGCLIGIRIGFAIGKSIKHSRYFNSVLIDNLGFYPVELAFIDGVKYFLIVCIGIIIIFVIVIQSEFPVPVGKAFFPGYRNYGTANLLWLPSQCRRWRIKTASSITLVSNSGKRAGND